MKCFEELSLEIVKNRRLGDIDPDKKMLEMLSKLCVNSLYFATLLNTGCFTIIETKRLGTNSGF